MVNGSLVSLILSASKRSIDFVKPTINIGGQQRNKSLANKRAVRLIRQLKNKNC